MAFSFLTLLIVVAVILAAGFLLLFRGSSMNWDLIKGILVMIVFGALCITAVIAWILPDVTVITQKGKGFEHENKIVLGSYNGKSMSLFHSYIGDVI